MIFLDIEQPGLHTIHFSMREDGFEFDKWLMTTDKNMPRPSGVGPAASVHVEKLTPAFTTVEAANLLASQKPLQQPTTPPLALPRKPDGSGSVAVSANPLRWHKTTLTLDGPYAHELDNAPNPFTDLAIQVTFTHESGSPSYVVPDFFAADGNAK